MSGEPTLRTTPGHTAGGRGWVGSHGGTPTPWGGYGRPRLAGRSRSLPPLSPGESPALGMMLCSSWLDMFNTFIFELVFGK